MISTLIGGERHKQTVSWWMFNLKNNNDGEKKRNEEHARLQDPDFKSRLALFFVCSQQLLFFSSLLYWRRVFFFQSPRGSFSFPLDCQPFTGNREVLQENQLSLVRTFVRSCFRFNVRWFGTQRDVNVNWFSGRKWKVVGFIENKKNVQL